MPTRLGVRVLYRVLEKEIIMTVYIFGRIKGNNTVHLFREGSSTPECGSGNTHNINGRLRNRVEVEVIKSGDPQGEIVTCKKCQNILYGKRRE